MENKMLSDSLSKFNKFNKFTKYQFEVETPLWFTFKAIANMRGLKVKEAIKEALIEYIQNHKLTHQNIEVKIIRNHEAKTNLLQFIREHEIKTLLEAIIEAQKRDAPKTYIDGLKLKIIDNVKKTPQISEELANQIKIVFQNLRRD